MVPSIMFHLKEGEKLHCTWRIVNKIKVGIIGVGENGELHINHPK